MIKTQIYLLELLYREVQRLACEQDWSIAEVIRRGADAVARTYPPLKRFGACPLRFVVDCYWLSLAP